MRETPKRNRSGGAGEGSKRIACCPICERPTIADFKPFCSGRCADIDLGRWLTGRYAIAGNAEVEEDELPPASSPSDPDRIRD